MTGSQCYVHYGSSITSHLKHDHSESIKIRFLARISTSQDLRCRPPCTMCGLTHGRASRNQVFGNSQCAKTRDACVGGVIDNVYKDVNLAGYQ